MFLDLKVTKKKIYYAARTERGLGRTPPAHHHRSVDTQSPLLVLLFIETATHLYRLLSYIFVCFFLVFPVFRRNYPIVEGGYFPHQLVIRHNAECKFVFSYYL